MVISYLLIMACGVFISSVSQILLKISAEKNIGAKGFKAQYLNKFVIIGYLLLFIAMLIPVSYTHLDVYKRQCSYRRRKWAVARYGSMM